MSGIMSDNPTDWSQFYQQNLSNQGLPPIRTMFGDRVADATAVTTTATTTTINTTSVQNPIMGSGNSSSSAGHLSPEGRVAKPIRRRSRASRRTPTTLLNTDTTNFRAMVQQFTGGPSAPFASGSQINATNFGFALGHAHRQPHQVNHPSPVMMPPGYHLQYQQQQQQQQQQFQQQSQQPYLFSLGNSNIGTSTTTTSTTTPGHDMFFQRLGNPRASTSIEVSDHGFVSTEGAVISSLQVAPPSRPPPPPSSTSNENRSNTFLF